MTMARIRADTPRFAKTAWTHAVAKFHRGSQIRLFHPLLLGGAQQSGGVLRRTASATVRTAAASAGAEKVGAEVQLKLQTRCMYTRAGSAGAGGGRGRGGEREALLPFQKKLRFSDLQAKKQAGQKISMLTAYDVCSTQILENALIDMILVGDSLANVVLAARRAVVVFDLPFGSYYTPELAMERAITVVKETGITAVKFEGFCPDIVKALSPHVNVVCHLGVQPQTAESMASRGKKAQHAIELVEQSLALEAAGCKMLVLEKVCAEVADAITSRLKIPTIGIGSGPDCDGQVLVYHDIFGLSPSTPTFKFVKQYCQVHPLIEAAAAQYKQEVDAGTFPGPQHSFFMSPVEREKFFSLLRSIRSPGATVKTASVSRLCGAVGVKSRDMQEEGQKTIENKSAAKTREATSDAYSPVLASSGERDKSAGAPKNRSPNSASQLLQGPNMSSSGDTAPSACVSMSSHNQAPGRPTEGRRLSLVQQWLRKGLAGGSASSSKTSSRTQATPTGVEANAAEAETVTDGSVAKTKAPTTECAAATAGGTHASCLEVPAAQGRAPAAVGSQPTVAAGHSASATRNCSEGLSVVERTPDIHGTCIMGAEEPDTTQVTSFLQKIRRIGIRGGGALGQFVACALAGVPHVEVTLFTKREDLRTAALARGGCLCVRLRTLANEETGDDVHGVSIRENAEGQFADKVKKEENEEGISLTSTNSRDFAVKNLRAGAVQTVAIPGVHTPHEPVEARQVRVVTNKADIPDKYFDAVFICTKSWQTMESAAFALDKTAPGGVVVTLQNGLEAPSLLRDAFKNAKELKRMDSHKGGEQQQDVSLVFAPTTYGAREEAPGVALMTGEGVFRIQGEAASTHVAAAAVASLLRHAGLKARLGAPGDLLSALWEKAAVNACINPLTAILRCRNKELAHPALRAIRARVVMETVSVARARGIPLQREATEELIEAVIKNTGENISSMLTDVINGRPTEIEAVNGEIVREAKKAGLSVPVVECLRNLVHFISETSAENARRRPDV